MLQHLNELSVSSLLLLSIGIYSLYLVLEALREPLKRIPGPFLARFTRLWYFYQVYRGTFELKNIELHKQYGPVVRVAPHYYSVDDIEAAKTIYGHGSSFIKAPWYWAWQAPILSRASLFSDRDPAHHAFQRRKYATAYSMSSLVGYESFVDECSQLLTERFGEIAQSGQTINLGHWLQCYAFDVIGAITFANRFGFLDMGKDKVGIFKAIDQRGVYSTFVGIFSSLHSLLYPFLPKTGGPVYLTEYTVKQISDRERLLRDPRNSGSDGPPDFMTKFLKAHEADPEKMTKLDLVTIFQSNIAAGSDTTAITLSAIFYYLLKNPSTYQVLQTEISDAEVEGRISDPVTFKESRELPYLQAVIREALRIHSATGLPMFRVVPPSGTTILDYKFPAGSVVGINAWVAHRNQSVYGADADIWRPERWLEFEEQGRTGEVERYNLAFGLGSRTCIGKNISLLEMSKLVPQLVRNFEFALDEHLEGRVWTTLNRWFVKQLDFNGKVRLKGRRADSGILRAKS